MFYLNFSKIEAGRDPIKMLRDLLFMDLAHAIAKKHTSVLARLTAQRNTATAGKAARIELGIVLPPRGLSKSEFLALVQLLDDFVEHEDAKDTTTSAAVHYEITSLWISFSKVLVVIYIKILTEMMASKTCTICHLNFEDAKDMLSLGEGYHEFQKLLRVSVCSLGGNRPTLETLQLFSAPFEDLHVAAIFSALRYPNSLKKLHLDWVKPN